MRARVVAGDRLIGGLAGLEPLAELVFGRGRRSPDWLARKLVRECVEPATSALLIEGEAEPDVPIEIERVIGYALVGRPPSLGELARGAGVGVHPAFRGVGLGAQLLAHAAALARGQGARALEFLAEPPRVAWYARHAFVPVYAEWTLLTEASGERDELEPGELVMGRGQPRWSWFPEAWQHTPADERFVFTASIGELELSAWVTREGRARLIHRLELGEPGHALDLDRMLDALARVRAALPRGTPLLLHPCPAQREWSVAALAQGWSIAQRSWVVRRTFP